jgi:hypothetical protein
MKIDKERIFLIPLDKIADEIGEKIRAILPRIFFSGNYLPAVFK